MIKIPYKHMTFGKFKGLGWKKNMLETLKHENIGLGCWMGYLGKLVPN